MPSMRKSLVPLAAAALVLIAGCHSTATPARAAVARPSTEAVGPPCTHVRVRNDFNGDGISDLIVRAGTKPAGFAILYGTENGGFDIDHPQLLPYGSMVGPDLTFNGVNPQMATGFFDRDCYADLAVEINRELTELHGSRTGLMLRGRQFLAGTAIGDGTLVPSSAGIMTAGDFNGDGLSDVVVATVKPSNIEPTAICIAYGSPTGLVAGHHCLAEGRDGVPGAPRANGFGTAFAVGDLNGDHRDDLAIGTPDATSNGAVVVLYGSVDGLSAAGSTYLSAGASGVLGPRPHPASFAEQLTIGNITGSGAALIVAATGQGNQDTGAPRIMVFPGGPSGVRSTAAQRFIFDKGKPSEIISGDFDGDDHADLAVEEDIMLGPFKSAGQVNIMYGTAHGLTTRGQRVISPLSPALRFDPLAVKNPFALEFGISMGTMPTTGSPAASLIVGVPHDLGGEEGTSNAWVVILPGGRNGPDVAHRSIISAKQQSWAYVLSTGGNWPSY